jgi:hypothetical protein
MEPNPNYRNEVEDDALAKALARIEALEAVVVAGDREIKRSHIDADQLRERIEALSAALRKAIEALQWHDAVPEAIKANAVLEQDK